MIMLKSQLVRRKVKLYACIYCGLCLQFQKVPLPSPNTHFFGLYRVPNPLGKTVLLGLSIEDIHSVAL